MDLLRYGENSIIVYMSCSYIHLGLIQCGKKQRHIYLLLYISLSLAWKTLNYSLTLISIMSIYGDF